MEIGGRRFLIIGGAGLIGSHLVERLTRTDAASIVVYDSFSRGRIENLAEALKDPRVIVFEAGGDVVHRDVLARAMEGVDGVFHLAALWLLQCYEFPEAAFEVNIRGTFNVIQAAIAAKVKRVVFSSSASVYGNALTLPITEEHPYNNDTFYGATKIAGEHMFRSLGHRYGLPWIGLRYMNVYGPRQDYRGAYVAVMMNMLDRIDQGLPPIVAGSGDQRYDFVYVTDVAEANVRAMSADVSGRCFNVGTGKGTSINELAALLLRLTGREDLNIERRAATQQFVTSRVGSAEAAATHLGFTASVHLEEGMRRLIEWRRSHKEASLATI
jgi:UDP-glucose 4-epimerase